MCNYYNIELILFISPASPDERIQEVLLKAPGCIYLVTSYGVTGLRTRLEDYLFSLVKKIRNTTDKRIMLGFGISNTQQVSQIMSFNLHIDAIVMGSAFIQQITSGYTKNDYKDLIVFCENIKDVMKR